MEIAVDIAAETVEELREEAELQGFDDLEAYLRWILAHRPMSNLGSEQAPAVASRVSELEERVKLIERQLGLDDPADPDADLRDGGSAGGGLGSGDATLEGGFETKSGEPLSESGPDPDEPEDAAADDDIAEAIGDVSLDDEDG